LEEFEVWEALKQIQEDNSLTFKYIVKGETATEREKPKSSFYLKPCFWAGNLFVKVLEKHQDGSIRFLNTIPMGERVRCIKTKELDYLSI